MYKKFIQASRAWYKFTYCDDYTMEEVWIGTEEQEFVIEWNKVGKTVNAKLVIWDDSWNFEVISDVLLELNKLSQKEDILKPKEVCQMLLNLGYEDITPTERISNEPII